VVRIEHIRLAAYIAFIIVLFLIPQFVGVFGLNRVSGYLAYGAAGVAMSLAWGNGGILNLGQGAFFGAGAYSIAMALMLQHSGPDVIPKFMELNAEPDAPHQLCCIAPGTFVWIPFRQLWFGLLWGIVGPVVLALAVAAPMFYRRVTGVYVAIITLALVVALQLVIINNQPITGGFNGLAELARLSVGGVIFDPYTDNSYYLLATVLSLMLLGGRWLVTGRAGLVLRAIQSNEDRMRFLGYRVEAYKMVFFALSAAVAGLAGMMYVTVALFSSPALMAVSFSVSMVIWAAVGGRASLLGACLGAIAVNAIGDAASESQLLQPIWPLILGGLFIGTVLFLPGGFVGWLDRFVERLLWFRGGIRGNDVASRKTAAQDRAGPD